MSVTNPKVMVHCCPSVTLNNKSIHQSTGIMRDCNILKQTDSYVSRFPDDLIRSTTCLWVKPSVPTPLIFARTSPGRCQEKKMSVKEVG